TLFHHHQALATCLSGSAQGIARRFFYRYRFTGYAALWKLVGTVGAGKLVLVLAGGYAAGVFMARWLPVGHYPRQPAGTVVNARRFSKNDYRQQLAAVVEDVVQW